MVDSGTGGKDQYLVIVWSSKQFQIRIRLSTVIKCMFGFDDYTKWLWRHC